jgi:hypothetical protein
LMIVLIRIELTRNVLTRIELMRIAQTIIVKRSTVAHRTNGCGSKGPRKDVGPLPLKCTAIRGV